MAASASKAITILFLLSLAVNVSHALDSKNYNAAFNIVDSKVVVEKEILFKGKTTDILTFQLPEDYEALSVYVDDKLVFHAVEEDILKIMLNGNSKISFSYVTEELVDKSDFLMNFMPELNADELEIRLVLPEEAVLRKPLTDAAGSVYPRPDKAETDGRSLILVWEKTGAKAGDEIPIFVRYKTKANYLPVVGVLGAVVLLLLFYLFYIRYTRRVKHAKETRGKLKEKPAEEEPEILKHLKPDEQQIINVLKQKEGRCEQGTLRIITGFSKATLSRLLKELEDRKVVYKEKRGKKNLVFLRKQLWNILEQ